jgi:hypothetical protein
VSKQNEMVDAATAAIQEAVRQSTVGIVYGSGSLKWKGIGTFTLITWKTRSLVLTADHVIRGTLPEDLRFFLPLQEQPGTVSRETLRALTGAPSSALHAFKELQLGRIVGDKAIDLAAIEVDADLDKSYPVRFFELSPGGGTPSQGTDILATGFPLDIARQTFGGEVTVFYHTEWTEVGPARDGLENFDPAVHVLADYHTAKDYPEAAPSGLSGSGVWFHAPTPAPSLWHPNIDFVGVTSSWYKKQQFIKIIRREIVEAFLDSNVRTADA